MEKTMSLEHHCTEPGHEHPQDGSRRAPRAGILMAMFGTTRCEAQTGYDVQISAISARFPGIPIFQSYTADKVRRKMKRLGHEALSVSQALMDMYDNGFTHVAVQSVHAIPGIEYEWTCRQARALEHPRKGLQKIVVGDPLLTEKTLNHAAAQTSEYIPSDIGEKEAVVLVGHGAYHAAQVYYHAFQSALYAISSNRFVGTLMGRGLGMDTILKKLSSREFRTVHLLPFMGVPGHHFMLDMSGAQEDSWRSILVKHGYACVCHELGTAGSAAFMPLWLDNLHKALLQLGDVVARSVQPLPCHPGNGESPAGACPKQTVHPTHEGR